MESDPRDLEICAMVKSIACALSANPHQIEASTTQQGPIAIITITAHPGDIGRLLGKGGRTVRSIRVVLQAVSMSHNKHYRLDIKEHAADNVPRPSALRSVAG